LDEPTEGVWVGAIEETWAPDRVCKEFAVILVEQHLDLALHVTHYADVPTAARVAL